MVLSFTGQRSNHSRRYMHCLHSLILGALLVGTTPANATPADRQNRSPLITVKAQKSLQLDITQAGERLISVGERGHILFSDDQGEHWQQAQVPGSSTLTAVYFADTEYGWAVGHDGLVLHSKDGGRSWKTQLDGNQINQLLLVDAETRLKGLQRRLDNGADSDALELALEEAEIALEDAQIALEEGPTSPLLDLWFKDRHYGMVTGAYGILLMTEDGGQSWHPPQQGPHNPDRFHFNAIAATADNQLLLAGEAGALFRSGDGGRHWQTLDSPYEGSFFGIQPLDDQSTLLFGLRGNLYLSKNQGNSWQKLSGSGQTTLFASTRLEDGRTILGTANGQLYSHSADGVTKLPLRVRRPISAISARNDTLYLAGPGGISQHALTRPSAQEAAQ